MGRNKIDIKLISDLGIKKVTFKKRAKGLLMKAIELSKLTGAKIQLKVYNQFDQSLLEYFSTSENELDPITVGNEALVSKSCRFYDRDLS